MSYGARLFFLPILLISALLLHAQSRIECDALDSKILKRPIHYCVYLPAGYSAAASRKTYPLLYFLHGLGDNERTLFNSGGFTFLEEMEQRHKIGEFLIAAPEGGRSFYINSADGNFRYNDFFLQEFMPLIEKKYRAAPGRKNRAITGISMGGYGALRLAFAHPELFSAVSAQSAALITETPEELDLAVRSGAPLGRLLGTVFGTPIAPEHWKENSPFVLAPKNAAALRGMTIYFNCGKDDNYGFEKGAAALHEELEKLGIKHEYHLYPGDHSFGYFLAHFDEVIEFHSHAFGLH
ncbi:MAG TPA: alpha/beta hydrolase family protein [Candidatus Binatia bacterium]|nr:alpha/beta hydrolase family protein [Candidatus Binatia bacterium]